MKHKIKDLAATTPIAWGTIAEKIDENFEELEINNISVGDVSSFSVSPNTRAVFNSVIASPIDISLIAPTDTNKVNEYVVIVNNASSITFDKSIVWANDNAPVIDDSAGEILEINITCINLADSSICYLGTWAKYTV